MDATAHTEKRWTRWHSDNWTAIVVKTEKGEWLYNAWQGAIDDTMHRGAGLADAQHRAEEIVRSSGHRCIARCSFWVPDVPEEPD